MTGEQPVPDFSGDDFAHDKEIQRNRAEAKARAKLIDDSLAIIQQELGMEQSSHTNFKKFLMFKPLNATVTYSMKGNGETAVLRASMVHYFSSVPTYRSSNAGHDLYFFGHLALPSEYPVTYINRETLREKTEDLFLRRDVDFPHSKRFSRRFQVLTEDKFKLEQLFLLRNPDHLTAFPDMELECSGKVALFRNSRKPVSLHEARKFCNLAKVLLSFFHG